METEDDPAHVSSQPPSPTSSTSSFSSYMKGSSCGECTDTVAMVDEQLQCDRCKNKYHLKCTKVNTDVYSVMCANNCLGEFVWRCGPCKLDTQSQQSRDNMMMDLIKSLQFRISTVERKLQNRSEPSSFIQNQKPLSTAKKLDAVSHQLVMTPKENEELTLQSFAQIARKKLPNIPIQRLGVTKTGQGYIKLPSKSDCDEAVKKLEESYNVRAEDVERRNLLPKITIQDLDGSHFSNSNKDELKTAILNKNPLIKSLVDGGKQFDVLFIVPDKIKKTSKAVVKLDPEILKVIKQQKYRLFVEFGSCRVSDRFFINQCYRCQKFGHRSATCPLTASNIHICRYCSSCHESSTCKLRKERNNKENLKCCNCNGNHSTTDVSCPSLQRQVNSLLARTKGMEDVPKNSIPPHAIVT